MIVFLNGQFVPEQQAVVSVFDRGFLYGDGLFETLLVRQGQPFRWGQHLDRLQRGAQVLRLPLPFPPQELRRHADDLLRRNERRDAVLRLTLSRGAGPRGYSIPPAGSPSLVMTLHPAPVFDPQAPPRWRLFTSTVRVPTHDPLAAIKTCNQLPHILARAEAEDHEADEALLLNTDGNVAEAASGNLFWIQEGQVCTPPPTEGALAGVTRAVTLELCAALGLSHRKKVLRPEALRQADGVFVTMSTLGLVEAVSLDGQPLPLAPQVETLRQAYWRQVALETQPPPEEAKA